MSLPAERSAQSDTAARILGVAERLVQTRGFNGFSYADIAAELNITKASLHYHFASKADLGRALIVGYIDKFNAALADIDAAKSPGALNAYVQLYENVLLGDRMCLCGMLAAEYATLPPAMQSELRRFFDNNESWLAICLEGGRAAGGLQFAGSALEAARELTAALEGAMLLARSYEEPARFVATAKRLLAELTVSRAAAPRIRKSRSV